MASELGMLIKQLNVKEKRYSDYALRTLHERSKENADVYRYWSILEFKLLNRSSYQRKIGLILLSANTKWDKENRLDLIIEDYLALANDENFETALLCVQCLSEILPYKPQLRDAIAQKLNELDYTIWEEEQAQQIKNQIDELFASDAEHTMS